MSRPLSFASEIMEESIQKSEHMEEMPTGGLQCVSPLVTDTRVMLPACFSPLERVLLTSDGNIQRFLSALMGKEVFLIETQCLLLQAPEQTAWRAPWLIQQLAARKESQETQEQEKSTEEEQQMIDYTVVERVYELRDSHQQILCSAVVEWCISDPNLARPFHQQLQQRQNNKRDSRMTSSLFDDLNKQAPDSHVISLGKSEDALWRTLARSGRGVACLLYESFPVNLFEVALPNLASVVVPLTDQAEQSIGTPVNSDDGTSVTMSRSTSMEFSDKRSSAMLQSVANALETVDE